MSNNILSERNDLAAKYALKLQELYDQCYTDEDYYLNVSRYIIEIHHGQANIRMPHNQPLHDSIQNQRHDQEAVGQAAEARGRWTNGHTPLLDNLTFINMNAPSLIQPTSLQSPDGSRAMAVNNVIGNAVTCALGGISLVHLQ
jgi:hypothetical protein